jgi:tetratricopeptide (TPR) repeat protein
MAAMTLRRIAFSLLVFILSTEGIDTGLERQQRAHYPSLALQAGVRAPRAEYSFCLPVRAEPAKDSLLPLSHLRPAKLVPGLCCLKYRISTISPECQAFFNQGLGYFYSYVWMEAARSFETATRYDPDCAMAWWGLSRALERWQKPNQKDALRKAQVLLPRASDREQLLIKARLQEKGLLPELAKADPQTRTKAAIGTIEQLLALYDDDEEGWFYRAQLACNGALFGGNAASAAFYHALLRLNPLHPGANHELVHFYEGFTRPALGWPFAEKYIASSPLVPHALHMQAHLAMRLGRWDKTTDRSLRAIELENAYHKEMGVAPGEDHQFSHHLETLMRGLIHDGRFEEARKLRKECEGYGFEHRLPWFRLALATRDWSEALRLAGRYKGDKTTASYLRALVYLAQGNAARAAPEVAVLQEAYAQKRKDRKLELRLWEVQGMLLCQQGDGDAGLKLLAKLVQQTKDDYSHHAWGQGALYMEEWGISALHAGRLDVAEEAFLESLAHDPGSARAALGLQIICQRQGRSQEAARYAELAHRCWRHASPETFQVELASLRGELATKTQSTQR